jgi:circadian clock protein KaiC
MEPAIGHLRAENASNLPQPTHARLNTTSYLQVHQDFMTIQTPVDRSLVTTGVPGLDSIVGGGLPRNRLYLVQGDPGAGKTTLALQMLLEGERLGERGLYVTLSESESELNAVAHSHGWSLERVGIYELSAADGGTSEDEENTLYVPAEVELGERIQALLAEVDRVRPARIVIDSCSELRLLAQSPLRFRRQVLALKAELVRRGCTIVLLDNPSSDGGNELLQSLVHGVIHMEQLSPLYGAERRRLRVTKLREVAFRGGYHDLCIKHTGIEVFPRLVAAEHHEAFSRELVSSGLAELDSLLGGGPERGTSALIVGPSGSGKSALAIQYSVAAAKRGERAAIFTFDEGYGTLMARSASIGMDLAEHTASGVLSVQQVDPAELSPGQFVATVRDMVDKQGARVLVIDSLNGYLHAMPEEKFLLVQLHELLSYLRQRGVLCIMVVVQHGFFGDTMAPVDVSYLADSVLLTRYFEAAGRVRKALSVVKKRAGRHENTIREFSVGPSGIVVGPALTQFHGVLTGVPIYHGTSPQQLLEPNGV